MASQKKKRKLRNSHCTPGWLKNKTIKLKRIGFYTSARRRLEKKFSIGKTNLIEYVV